MRASKECAECGGVYFRAEGYTDQMWEARRYCGPQCAGKAAARRHREKKEEQAAAREEVAPEPEPAPVALAPAQRELRIVRVGPNPRLLVCEYYELASRRTCTVQVKRTEKFVRGMRFKMAEPETEEAFGRPWVYQGKAPRHRGRW